jgi:hypothetical protein
MKKLLLIFILSASLLGCMSKDEQSAIDKITEAFHPVSLAVGSGISMETNRKELKFKSITLTGGETLSNLNIKDESIASMVALTFYQNLSEETLEDRNTIKVILERPLNGNLITTESFYFIDTLSLINRGFSESTKIAENVMVQNYGNIYKQLHSEIQSIISPDKFDSLFQELDSKYGKVKTYKISKFNEKSWLDVDSLKKRPVVCYTIELKRDLMDNNLYLKYSLKNTKKAILGFQITKVEVLKSVD